MAKKSVIQRNLKRVVISQRMKSKRNELKAKIKDLSLPVSERFALQLCLSKLSKDSSSVRVRNRCVLTGRPRGVYRKFNICRHLIRELGAIGQIPGLTKSSW